MGLAAMTFIVWYISLFMWGLRSAAADEFLSVRTPEGHTYIQHMGIELPAGKLIAIHPIKNGTVDVYYLSPGGDLFRFREDDSNPEQLTSIPFDNETNIIEIQISSVNVMTLLLQRRSRVWRMKTTNPPRTIPLGHAYVEEEEQIIAIDRSHLLTLDRENTLRHRRLESPAAIVNPRELQLSGSEQVWGASFRYGHPGTLFTFNGRYIIGYRGRLPQIEKSRALAEINLGPDEILVAFEVDHELIPVWYTLNAGKSQIRKCTAYLLPNRT